MHPALEKGDMEFLLEKPQFRRFLYAAIQTAGILSNNPHADGRKERDLSIFEGRRCLGFDLLRMADEGQPEPLRSPEALATLAAIIRTAMTPKEKPDGRRSDDDHRRYDD